MNKEKTPGANTYRGYDFGAIEYNIIWGYKSEKLWYGEACALLHLTIHLYVIYWGVYETIYCMGYWPSAGIATDSVVLWVGDLLRPTEMKVESAVEGWACTCLCTCPPPSRKLQPPLAYHYLQWTITYINIYIGCRHLYVYIPLVKYSLVAIFSSVYP